MAYKLFGENHLQLLANASQYGMIQVFPWLPSISLEVFTEHFDGRYDYWNTEKCQQR
jgi:hypothetical protein